MAVQTDPSVFVTSEALLEHWQGHRRLTRRMIAAFPQDQLFSFTIGGMRTFGEQVRELLGIGAPMVRGLLTAEWTTLEEPEAGTRGELLRLWDEATAEIETLWPQIPPSRFQDQFTAFGAYQGIGYDQILYAIDNEIHHRAQGFVYLRALGVEPPAFHDRT